jgi:hypothetical protein
MDKAKLVPTGGEYMEVRQILKRDSGDRVNTFERNRQGSSAKKRIRVVCRCCNGGWMGDLETEVKPFLPPLIKGARVTLTAPMRRIISEWIVMKVMTFEHNPFPDMPADPIFDQAARDAFRQARTIPPGFRIWIASQRGEKWSGGFHRHTSGLGITHALPPPPPPDPPTINVQTVTWGISRLLIYVNATTNMGVYPFLELGAGPLLRLWPLGDDIVWPPRYYVEDGFMDDLAISIENLIMGPNVIRQ